MKTKYIDIHSHISFPKFDEDREEVIERMVENETSAITVGVDLSSSKEAVLCAEKYENVVATVGLHPHDNKKEIFNPALYEDLVKHSNVVAVGECGLDYFRIGKNDEEEKNRQKKNFSLQVEFAIKHKKPLMIHGRPSVGTMDAYEDILSILEPVKGRVVGNVHFFVGSFEIAKRFFDLDFTISFTGVITFADNYNNVVKNAPLNMIMSETDCPYATPVPYRGKRNEPAHIPLIVEQIAKIRGEDIEIVKKQIMQNSSRVFGFPVSL